MELHFRSQALQRACTEERESDRHWGAECARIVRRRLVQLAAAESLAVLAGLRPVTLRELSSRHGAHFAVVALSPTCIIIEPWHDPMPTLPDGNVDKAKITAIRILAVTDSH